MGISVLEQISEFDGFLNYNCGKAVDNENEKREDADISENEIFVGLVSSLPLAGDVVY